MQGKGETFFTTFKEGSNNFIQLRKARGNYKVTFDASGFASGVYFYRIQAGEYSQVKKMVLIK